MATLVKTKSKTKTKIEDISNVGIENGIPEPFPLTVMKLHSSSRTTDRHQSVAAVGESADLNVDTSDANDLVVNKESSQVSKSFFCQRVV